MNSDDEFAFADQSFEPNVGAVDAFEDETFFPTAPDQDAHSPEHEKQEAVQSGAVSTSNHAPPTPQSTTVDKRHANNASSKQSSISSKQLPQSAEYVAPFVCDGCKRCCEFVPSARDKNVCTDCGCILLNHLDSNEFDDDDDDDNDAYEYVDDDDQ